MTNDELGALGESKLATLASQGGLVLNPARRDRTGFDGILEVATMADAPAPDLVSAPFRAFVQVKATQADTGSVGIKLSNWQRMVSDPAPWFVFVLIVDADAVEKEGFLVHVDQPLVECALKTLRQAEGDLHRHRLSCSYSEQHRLQRLHGSVLRDRLFAAIGPDPAAYQMRKHEHFKTCGYDGHPTRVIVTLPTMPVEEQVRQWVGLALGERRQLAFEDLRVEDHRFGIPVVRTDIPSGEGTLEANVPARAGRLHIEAAGGIDWVSLPVQIFSTTLLPKLPASERKLRIQAGPLSITLPLEPEWEGRSERSSPIGLQFDANVESPVSTIATAARALRLLCVAGASVYLSADPNNPVERNLMGKTDGVPRGAPSDGEIDEWIAAGEVAARVGLEGTVVSGLDLLEEMPRFTFLHAVLGQGLPDLEINVAVEAPDPPGERALIMCPAAVLRDRAIIACVALLATPRRVDDHLVFKPAAVRVGDVAFVPLSDVAGHNLHDRIQRLVNAVGAEVGERNVIPPQDTHRPLYLGNRPPRAPRS